ncbi:MAG TPA: riboflavin biosynthesis protein RibD, partial [Sphingomicrobium sp.]|nr:riboflavin biosynthesis protein RibD [Sphingomicrobium sp.]
MAEAVARGEDARGGSAPNPNVGCLVVSPAGKIIGKGATVYVTLEPCAHASSRGGACANLLSEAKPARVVVALKDPDPRTSGKGIKRLRDAGIDVKLG